MRPTKLLMVMGLVLWITTLSVESFARGGGGRGGSHGSSNNRGGHVGVKPYTKRDGTRVVPHHRTAPNSTQRDNFSSKPNVNPYTGAPGTKEPSR